MASSNAWSISSESSDGSMQDLFEATGKENEQTLIEHPTPATPEVGESSSYFPGWWFQGLFVNWRLEGKRNAAECNIKVKDKVCGTKIVDRSTSSFKRHLERFHKEKFEEELAKSQKESTDTSQRTMDDFTSTGTPHVLKRWHKNSCNQIALDNEVLKFFIDSLIPFYNVERKSFRNMIWKSEPRCNPLGRSGLHSKMNRWEGAVT